jgi:hypothetical protein
VEAKILFEQRQQHQDAIGQQEVFVDLVVVDDHGIDDPLNNAQQPKESSADEQRGIIHSGCCRGLQRLDQENGLPVGSEKILFNRTVGGIRLQLDWTASSNFQQKRLKRMKKSQRCETFFLFQKYKTKRLSFVVSRFVSPEFHLLG